MRNAMKDPPLSSQQAGGVSRPRVQQYVDNLLAGETPPAIKVDGSMIVDGKHGYIAGRILGQDTQVIQWLGGRPRSAVPWAEIPVIPEAWRQIRWCDLLRCRLAMRGAHADSGTRWPDGFDRTKHGVLVIPPT